MDKKISLQQFINLDENERKDYVLRKLELDEFWVMGNVENPNEKNPYFFINNLMNPYKMETIDVDIFSEKRINKGIYCVLLNESERIKDETLVIANIRISKDKKILENKPFFTTIEQVHVIEKQHQLLELMEKIPLELPMIAITNSKYYGISNATKNSLIEVVKKTAQKEQEQINKKLDLISSLGFLTETNRQVSEEKENLPIFEIPRKKETLIALVQEQLYLRGYYYERSFIRKLLLALTTEQLIILTGPSGTGKTSIVKQLANILDANYEIIPVQPSWTDKEDLIGFYNPVRNVFVPTAFLDCLINAKKEPEKLFFICLDEMNLAKIEYYLADILSIREIPNEKLRLYSDYEYEQNMAEISWFVEKILKENGKLEEVMSANNIDSKYQFDLVLRYKNMKRYTPQIEIPSNVRIIGTLNIDGAVQAISPKIVDRSFIIPLVNNQQEETIVIKNEKRKYALSSSAFKNDQIKNKSELYTETLDFREELMEWNVSFNKRVENHINQYASSANIFKVTKEQQIDDIVLMKFLPRIHGIFDYEKTNRLLRISETALGKNSTVFEKLNQMYSLGEETEIISYWS